jgi:hypothetical protein
VEEAEEAERKIVVVGVLSNNPRDAKTVTTFNLYWLLERTPTTTNSC